MEVFPPDDPQSNEVGTRPTVSEMEQIGAWDESFANLEKVLQAACGKGDPQKNILDCDKKPESSSVSENLCESSLMKTEIKRKWMDDAISSHHDESNKQKIKRMNSMILGSGEVTIQLVNSPGNDYDASPMPDLLSSIKSESKPKYEDFSMNLPPMKLNNEENKSLEFIKLEPKREIKVDPDVKCEKIGNVGPSLDKINVKEEMFPPNLKMMVPSDIKQDNELASFKTDLTNEFFPQSKDLSVTKVEDYDLKCVNANPEIKPSVSLKSEVSDSVNYKADAELTSLHTEIDENKDSCKDENSEKCVDAKKEDREKDDSTDKNSKKEDKKKKKFERCNIRDIKLDEELDAVTLSAQKEEQERIRRLQEAQMRALQERLQQIEVEKEALSQLFGQSAGDEAGLFDSDSLADSEANADEKKVVKTENDEVLIESSDEDKKSELGKSVTPTAVAKLEENVIDISSSSSGNESDSDESEKKDDDIMVLSDEGETAEAAEDPNNSGAHTNDCFNLPDEEGRVLVNVGHPPEDPDIFLAPQIAKVIKPHQIGGIRFLYDNVVENLERYKSSSGFGCILAHSMGLGKTVQVVSFVDVFLRHTPAKLVLCIVPINTIQNWKAEFDMWVPPSSVVDESLVETGEVRPRDYNIYTLNENFKTMAARAGLIAEWHTNGGVLLMGYEMYRMLALRKMPKVPLKKSKRMKKQEQNVEPETNEQIKKAMDEMYEHIVIPGPDLVICDEGHRIKNSLASTSMALKSIKTRRRVVLTGYPLQNNLLEYWCMVDFVRPNYLGSRAEFCNMFERPISNGQCIDSTPRDRQLMRFRSHVLHSLLVGFVQRRGHSVLRAVLPKKEEHVLLIRMTPIQRQLYKCFVKDLLYVQQATNPLKLFAVCCKIWNHPDILYKLLQEKKAQEDIDLDIDISLAASSGTSGRNACGRKRGYQAKTKAQGSLKALPRATEVNLTCTEKSEPEAEMLTGKPNDMNFNNSSKEENDPSVQASKVKLNEYNQTSQSNCSSYGLQSGLNSPFNQSSYNASSDIQYSPKSQSSFPYSPRSKQSPHPSFSMQPSQPAAENSNLQPSAGLPQYGQSTQNNFSSGNNHNFNQENSQLQSSFSSNAAVKPESSNSMSSTEANFQANAFQTQANNCFSFPTQSDLINQIQSSSQDVSNLSTSNNEAYSENFQSFTPNMQQSSNNTQSQNFAPQQPCFQSKESINSHQSSNFPQQNCGNKTDSQYSQMSNQNVTAQNQPNYSPKSPFHASNTSQSSVTNPQYALQGQYSQTSDQHSPLSTKKQFTPPNQGFQHSQTSECSQSSNSQQFQQSAQNFSNQHADQSQLRPNHPTCGDASESYPPTGQQFSDQFSQQYMQSNQQYLPSEPKSESSNLESQHLFSRHAMQTGYSSKYGQGANFPHSQENASNSYPSHAMSSAGENKLCNLSSNGKSMSTSYSQQDYLNEPSTDNSYSNKSPGSQHLAQSSTHAFSEQMTLPSQYTDQHASSLQMSSQFSGSTHFDSQVPKQQSQFPQQTPKSGEQYSDSSSKCNQTQKSPYSLTQSQNSEQFDKSQKVDSNASNSHFSQQNHNTQFQRSTEPSQSGQTNTQYNQSDVCSRQKFSQGSQSTHYSQQQPKQYFEQSEKSGQFTQLYSQQPNSSSAQFPDSNTRQPDFSKSDHSSQQSNLAQSSQFSSDSQTAEMFGESLANTQLYSIRGHSSEYDPGTIHLSQQYNSSSAHPSKQCDSSTAQSSVQYSPSPTLPSQQYNPNLTQSSQHYNPNQTQPSPQYNPNRVPSSQQYNLNSAQASQHYNLNSVQTPQQFNTSSSQSSLQYNLNNALPSQQYSSTQSSQEYSPSNALSSQQYSSNSSQVSQQYNPNSGQASQQYDSKSIHSSQQYNQNSSQQFSSSSSQSSQQYNITSLQSSEKCNPTTTESTRNDQTMDSSQQFLPSDAHSSQQTNQEGIPSHQQLDHSLLTNSASFDQAGSQISHEFSSNHSTDPFASSGQASQQFNQSSQIYNQSNSGYQPMQAPTYNSSQEFNQLEQVPFSSKNKYSQQYSQQAYPQSAQSTQQHSLQSTQQFSQQASQQSFTQMTSQYAQSSVHSSQQYQYAPPSPQHFPQQQSHSSQQFSKPVASPQHMSQTAPSPQQFSQAAPSPQQFSQPVPSPQQFSQPVPSPQQFSQPVPSPQQFSQPVPSPQQFSQPAPSPQQTARSPQQFSHPTASPQQFSQPNPTSQQFSQSALSPKQFQQPTPSPQQFQQPTPSPQQYQQPTPSPQQYQQLTPSPQQYQQPTPSPQQYQQPTPSPQQYQQPTPSPQQYQLPTPSPQQYQQPTSSPQQFQQPIPSPQQFAQPNASPQQFQQPPPSPQQFHQPTASPQQFSQPNASPQQFSQPTPSPQQFSQPTPSPQQFSQPTPSPQQFSQTASSPQQYSHPVPSPQQFSQSAQSPQSFSQQQSGQYGQQSMQQTSHSQHVSPPSSQASLTQQYSQTSSQSQYKHQTSNANQLSKYPSSVDGQPQFASPFSQTQNLASKKGSFSSDYQGQIGSSDQNLSNQICGQQSAKQLVRGKGKSRVKSLGQASLTQTSVQPNLKPPPSFSVQAFQNSTQTNLQQNARQFLQENKSASFQPLSSAAAKQENFSLQPVPSDSSGTFPSKCSKAILQSTKSNSQEVTQASEATSDIQVEPDQKSVTSSESAVVPFRDRMDSSINYEWAVPIMKDYVLGVLENSHKMMVLFVIIAETLQMGDKLLVFSQSLSTLDLLEQFLSRIQVPRRPNQLEPMMPETWARNKNYFRLDGSTSAQEREKLINEFNRNDSVSLFLLSTRAGCLGINLVGANRIVVMDASWNPCHDAQAVCRIYRYGQKKQCYIYRLVTDNSLEKRIYDRQVNKQGMSDRVVDELNPESNFTWKDVTTLIQDDEDDGPVQELSKFASSYSDGVLQYLVNEMSPSLSKEPFEHESLLLDRKDLKLTKQEKRLAKQSYEMAKRANMINIRTTYTYLPSGSGSGGQFVINNKQCQWVGGTTIRVLPNQGNTANARTGSTATPVTASPSLMSSLFKQGVMVQKLTMPSNVSIPVLTPGAPPVVIPAGQDVLVLRTPKGVYLRLPDGRIIAVQLPPSLLAKTQFRPNVVTHFRPANPKGGNSPVINTPRGQSIGIIKQTLQCGGTVRYLGPRNAAGSSTHSRNSAPEVIDLSDDDEPSARKLGSNASNNSSESESGNIDSDKKDKLSSMFSGKHITIRKITSSSPNSPASKEKCEIPQMLSKNKQITILPVNPSNQNRQKLTPQLAQPVRVQQMLLQPQQTKRKIIQKNAAKIQMAPLFSGKSVRPKISMLQPSFQSNSQHEKVSLSMTNSKSLEKNDQNNQGKQLTDSPFFKMNDRNSKQTIILPQPNLAAQSKSLTSSEPGKMRGNTLPPSLAALAVNPNLQIMPASSSDTSATCGLSQKTGLKTTARSSPGIVGAQNESSASSHSFKSGLEITPAFSNSSNSSKDALVSKTVQKSQSPIQTSSISDNNAVSQSTSAPESKNIFQTTSISSVDNQSKKSHLSKSPSQSPSAMQVEQPETVSSSTNSSSHVTSLSKSESFSDLFSKQKAEQPRKLDQCGNSNLQITPLPKTGSTFSNLFLKQRTEQTGNFDKSIHSNSQMTSPPKSGSSFSDMFAKQRPEQPGNFELHVSSNLNATSHPTTGSSFSDLFGKQRSDQSGHFDQSVNSNSQVSISNTGSSFSDLFPKQKTDQSERFIQPVSSEMQVTPLSKPGSSVSEIYSKQKTPVTSSGTMSVSEVDRYTSSFAEMKSSFMQSTIDNAVTQPQATPPSSKASVPSQSSNRSDSLTSPSLSSQLHQISVQSPSAPQYFPQQSSNEMKYKQPLQHQSIPYSSPSQPLPNNFASFQSPSTPSLQTQPATSRKRKSSSKSSKKSQQQQQQLQISSSNHMMPKSLESPQPFLHQPLPDRLMAENHFPTFPHHISGSDFTPYSNFAAHKAGHIQHPQPLHPLQHSQEHSLLPHLQHMSHLYAMAPHLAGASTLNDVQPPVSRAWSVPQPPVSSFLPFGQSSPFFNAGQESQFSFPSAFPLPPSSLTNLSQSDSNANVVPESEKSSRIGPSEL